MFISNNLSDLVEMIKNFRDHLKSIYEMEMFYGDETIKGMIEHTKHVLTRIEDFEEFYSLLSNPENIEEEENESVQAEENSSETKEV